MKRYIVILILMIGSTCFGNDVNDVAWTIWAEARGESYQGKVAVATVIYNRAMERRLTYQEVCKQRLQFSCWNGKKSVTYPVKNKMFKQCLEISKQLHSGMFNPTSNWNHYYNPSLCNPSWGTKMYNVKIIGNHRFGRL